MDATVVVGFFTTAIAALASCVAFLFKLHYVDTRKALDKCEQEHDKTRSAMDTKILAEQEDCERRLNKLSEDSERRTMKYQAVIDKLELRIDGLLKQVADYFTNRAKTERTEPQ